MSNKSIFEPYSLNGLPLKNRMVMAPMTRSRSDNAGSVAIEGTFISEEAYIIKRLNDYGLAYVRLIEPFTDVTGNPVAIQEVAKHFRAIYKGTIIINRTFNKETVTKVLDDGDADLVERYRTGALVNAPDQSTFYIPGEKGYTDYPTLNN